jgi:hypothetical protein
MSFTATEPDRRRNSNFEEQSDGAPDRGANRDPNHYSSSWTEEMAGRQPGLSRAETDFCTTW